MLKDTFFLEFFTLFYFLEKNYHNGHHDYSSKDVKLSNYRCLCDAKDGVDNIFEFLSFFYSI